MTVDGNELLRGLVDALLPSGHGFPAASATGMTGLLAARLLAADATLLGRVAAGLRAQGALPDSMERWHDAARLEADEPKLFEELRKYAYLTYYEQPGAISGTASAHTPSATTCRRPRTGSRCRRRKWTATSCRRPSCTMCRTTTTGA